MLMLMAAQSLKSSRERKRVAMDLTETENQSAERLQVLQSLLHEETIQSLVQEVIQAQSTTNSSSSSTNWWGSKSSASFSPPPAITDGQKQQLTLAVWKKMEQLVADTALDEAERVALRMRLQELEASSKPHPTTAEPAAGTNAAAETTKTKTATPKRVPFTM